MDETVASQFVHVGCSVSGRAGDFSDKAAPYKLVGGTLTSASYEGLPNTSNYPSGTNPWPNCHKFCEHITGSRKHRPSPKLRVSICSQSGLKQGT